VRLILTPSTSQRRESALEAERCSCQREAGHAVQTHSPREARKDQRTWRVKGRQSCCARTCQRSRPMARRARHRLFAQIEVGRESSQDEAPVL
jgi:hypothetical protein